MSTTSESKIAYVYGIFLILFLVIVVIFLLCDFNVLPDNICSEVNYYNQILTKAVNNFLGLK